MWHTIDITKLPTRPFDLRCYSCLLPMEESDYGACKPFKKYETKDFYNVCVICKDCYILNLVEAPKTAKEYRETFKMKINKTAGKIRDHYAEKKKKIIEQYNTEVLQLDKYFKSHIEDIKLRQDEKLKTIENRYDKLLVVANMRSSVNSDNLAKLNAEISDLNLQILDKQKMVEDYRNELFDLNFKIQQYSNKNEELQYEYKILSDLEARMSMVKGITISGIARIRNEILETTRKQISSLNEPIINGITAEFKNAIEKIESIGVDDIDGSVCGICFEQVEVNKQECGHEFCPDCWQNVLKNNIYRTYVPCPICRVEIKLSS